MDKSRPPYVHLHTHTHYSLLDGLSKPKQLAKIAKNDGQPAIAITDHGSMYGAIDFYMECKKADIKPIIGVEAYVANRTRFDKEAGIDNKRFHLTLLAMNEKGYKNLIKLTSLAYTEGFYYKPRMDKEILRMYSEGVIAMSGCPASELGRCILNTRDKAQCSEIIKEYQDIFGKDNYYIEIMNHPDFEHNTMWRNMLIELAKEHDIPLVATQDSHYPCIDDARAHKALIAISTASDIAEVGIFGGAGDYHFLTTDEAYKLFADTPEAVHNTSKLAERCNLEIILGKFVFPKFPLPPGKTDDELLQDLCYAGIKRRGLENDEKAKERLDYELGIIKLKGYASYFLVVEDLIRYSSENHIFTNIRGSVAGSMTTFTLGITKVNPLEYHIPFERFLNPDRPSAPDIDMDFSDTRREEVIEYAKKKYGADHVAQIGTFGTMLAKGSVKDVARTLGKPVSFGERLCKLIPDGAQGAAMTLEHAMELEPELKKIYETEAEVREVIDIAKRLEGTVRHVSVHAAGVVISPMPMQEMTPVQFDPKGGKLITQYDMYTVGEDGVGLTKFDFLGIRNLTILGDAVDLVKLHRGIDMDIEKIPLDDKKTFAILSRGETVGLFQLNGGGMTKWLMELRPTSIHDINAMVALYRPGPLQFIPEYIARKRDPSKIVYPHPAIKPLLERTYGVLVYQDDLLFMAHDLAGFSWGEVDKFRKAVGKKIKELMEEQKEKFIKGCVKHSGFSQKMSEDIWAWIEPFASYGFNKAHSVSYGFVAYQTAFMKANFPAEYMTAVLTNEAGDTTTVSEIMQECKRMKIPVLQPDINLSYRDFTTIKGEKESLDQIRFGLFTIKGLGDAISQAVIEERKENGPFTSFVDLLERVNHKDLNKKSLEALIRTGAFDSLGEDRGVLLHNIDDALEYHRIHRQEKESTQVSLFSLVENKSSLPKLRIRPARHSTLDERLKWERDLLGLYVTGHPLEKYKDRLSKATSIKSLIESGKENDIVLVAGIVEEIKDILTKKNEHMAFIKIADFTGSVEVIAFPRSYAEFKDSIALDKCVAIKAKFSKKDDKVSLLIEKVKVLEATPEQAENMD
jgi:DNA polymerase-3 subunit alpha